MTKTYIGVKIVTAWPCGKPGDSDVPGYAVRYSDDYESWSPKDVFEAAYREVPENEMDGDGLSAKDALAMTHAFIERCIGDRNWGVAGGANDDARRQRDIRETAVHLAAKVLPQYPAPRSLFGMASQIAAYINDGVAIVEIEPTDKSKVGE